MAVHTYEVAPESGNPVSKRPLPHPLQVVQEIVKLVENAHFLAVTQVLEVCPTRLILQPFIPFIPQFHYPVVQAQAALHLGLTVGGGRSLSATLSSLGSPPQAARTTSKGS